MALKVEQSVFDLFALGRLITQLVFEHKSSSCTVLLTGTSAPTEESGVCVTAIVILKKRPEF